ncbi:MAG: caspase family protein [Deltaproteobacteria bacterium]|nr:caspase family protein [Deltaproteobacteria bacterium]
MILDSCNSGTATRGPEAGIVKARFFKPMTEEAGAGALGEGTGESADGMATEALPGMVVFSAATDSNPALEKNGRGIFTDALIRVMMEVGERPLTYARVARLTPPLVSAESPQVPYFHGDLTGVVFGNETRTRPVAWEVKKTGESIEIAGPPMAGIGKGAEFRIYDGAVTGADTRDPEKAKATVVVIENTELNAKVAISAAKPDRPKIQPGDPAILVRPADAFITLKVRIRPSREGGGIPDERANGLRALIKQDSEARMLVEPTEGAGDFELSMDADSRLVLRGPENRVRNTYKSDKQAPQSLWRHARQRALLHLRGEGGRDFVDGQTLLVSLAPAPEAKQNKCAQKGVWRQAEPNSPQVIPLCYAWNVQVTLADEAPIPLLIGALILSTDGSIFALPRDDRKVRLQPGESYTFKATGETFRGTPPLDVQDRIIVFGTHEQNPVSWGMFTETAAARGARGPAPSGLHRALDRYLRPGTRGVSKVDEGTVEETTWTMSTVLMRVEANQRFLEGPVSAEQPVNIREYTIADFDIRPYLPDDENTALYRVLQKADWLARAAGDDGFGYKQHAWDRPEDEDNLRLGIDCSRAIWFAFTRAGLPYNRDNRYLTTAMMVSDDTLMSDEFENCSDDPKLRTGDILVYRDDTRGDGHVVMVIDPEKRIGWGSHGWDGNPRILPVEPDRGVEYQKIKFKSDWERWDRKTMTRKACLRYRMFSEETKSERGLPGLKALEDICVAGRNCGK